jgi:hypothetical protein
MSPHRRLGGTIHETFGGLDRDGRQGTLTFDETYRLNGSTLRIRIDAHIVDSTGDFTGARGYAGFVGLDPFVTGRGSYDGTWFSPRL